jgi:DMSO/TMAO reductase YedYZ molybdopterin-dependent catalytic subunit
MKISRKIYLSLRSCGIFLVAVLAISCDRNNPEDQHPGHSTDFPEFITPIEKYFKINISGNHTIDGSSYRLKISGMVNHPSEFTLEQLRHMKMIQKTVTIECIDNNNNGILVGTITWKGFNLYRLLDSLGIQDGVKFVKYRCSDGYFTYNTVEELKNGGVLGALYMNGETMPEIYGFPLRVIFPGYYGVRQPGWVVEIELLDKGIKDFWGETQFDRWNTDSTLALDSKIFFPASLDTFTLGQKVKIGGAAYGSRRISSVDVTVDDGKTWIPASIKQSMDEDYVWVFWEAEFTPHSAGRVLINAKATATDGRVQPRGDPNFLDGINAWPSRAIIVKDAN